MDMNPENLHIMIEFMKRRGDHDKAEKIEHFRHLNQYVLPGQTVMAGSSLMEQFPLYEFQQDFPIPIRLYNRGVGGFTTRELLENLDVCICDLKPSRLFLNIGTNDLAFPDYSVDTLIENYSLILQGIKDKIPDVKLFLLAYYPVNPDVAESEYMKAVFQNRTNARIDEANHAIEELSKNFGAVFLDLNEGLRDECGKLKRELTVDGMHMYADGYKAVLDRLLPVLLQSE